MLFEDVVTYCQAGATLLAILLNSFLVYVVTCFSRKSIGKYKWLLAGFATFEMVYAVVVFIGMPMNYIGFNSWLVFNHGGFIGNTRLAILGPTLYCIFYEVWISLVVAHFVYRYIALCRPAWKENIIHGVHIQGLLVTFYLLHLFYICFCAFFFCTANEMPKELDDDIRKVFDLPKDEGIGYILFRLKKPSGEYSLGSMASFLNHYLYVWISIVLILFCGFHIKREIHHLQSQSIKLRNVRLQKQIFMTLLIQTIIPIFLVHIPSGLYLTLPLLNSNVSLGSATIIFSFLSTLPKIIDPLIVLYGIEDYRHAVRRLYKPQDSAIQTVAITKTSGFVQATQLGQQTTDLG